MILRRKVPTDSKISSHDGAQVLVVYVSLKDWSSNFSSLGTVVVTKNTELDAICSINVDNSTVNCNLSICSFPNFHIRILTRCGVLETAVLNHISDFIYENNHKANSGYFQHSTLTQSRIFHRITWWEWSRGPWHRCTRNTFFCHDNTAWLQNKTIVCQHNSWPHRWRNYCVKRNSYGKQIWLLWNRSEHEKLSS